MFAIAQGRDGLPGVQLRGIQERLAETERAVGEDITAAALTRDFHRNLAALAEKSTGSDENGRTLLAFEAGRKLVSSIGDQSNLILDPDLDSYYSMSLTVLRFPELLDLLLRLPDVEEVGAEEQFLMTKGRLSALLSGIEADYKAACAGNPGNTLAPQLEPSRKKLIVALRALTETGSHHPINLPGLRQQAIGATQDAWRDTQQSLEGLLAARVEYLFHRMWTHLGMAAGLLVAILFVVFYIARQIAVPLRRLASVADAVQANNNYTLRATWSSGDEIGHLVTGFNTMLERLDHERLVQQELAVQARAAQVQRELLEAIPIPLLVTAIPDHHILHANSPAAAWVDASLTDPWAVSLSSGERARFFQRLADEGEANEFEVCWRGPSGTAWALLSARRLNYQGQESVLTTFAPINALKRLEGRLRLWASVFEASSEGILVFDRDNRILLANAAMARASGYRIDELVGREPDFLTSKQQDESTQRTLKQAVAEHGAWQGEYWIRRKTGSDVPHWMAINTVRDDLGEPTHTIALFVDISERKAQEARIQHIAHHDALTGLPNRLLFEERLRMSLQQAERHGERGALLFVDLDRFKNINDSLGHNIGDSLLQSVARRLEESLRAGDTVCRQGGDEFVVILNRVADAQEVALIVEQRLINLILKTHSISGVDLHISCSVGIAMFLDDGRDIDTLMRNADAAMYAAKAKGRNNFQFFNEEMNRHALERLNTENNLRHALERQEFELHVQPIVSVTTGELMSVEGLIRWRHPSMGMIPPVKFIPIAEQTGLIVEIGRWVIEETCRLHAQWAAAGLGQIPIAVNVSAIQFQRGGFAEAVAAELAKSGMPPSSLQLEVTETLVMTNSELVLAELRCLKSLGVALSLDDFGTGYSSLSYLHRFPFDKIKIDQSFIRDMIEDPADLVITRTIIGLGHSLGLRVVAEGVEHIEEFNVLRTAGCEEVQGYLISKPMPGWNFPTWLEEWRAGYCQEVLEQATGWHIPAPEPAVG